MFQYICQISLVAIEERVHPTPFRTRKLSSPSPMILHNVMWESRPLPKIVRRPPCSSQREGVFFVPGISFLCPCRAWTGRCLLVLSSTPLRLLPDASGVPSCRTAGDVLRLLHARPAGRRPYGVSLLAPRHDIKDPLSASVVDRPRYQPGIFCWEGMRCWPATKACPCPDTCRSPAGGTLSDARLTGVVVSWSFLKGNVTRQGRQADT